MKKFLIITSLITVLIAYSDFLYARPINPLITDPLINYTGGISVKYEEYSRETEFFNGYKKYIKFNNNFISLHKKVFNSTEIILEFGKEKVDLDNRKTDDYGYEARLILGYNIWGDLSVIPLWKTFISVSKGNCCLRTYNEYKIDIEHDFMSIDLFIICSKKYGIFVPYSGIKFSYLMDKYIENTTEKTASIDMSTFSPFAGLNLHLFRNFILKIEAETIGEKGVSGGISIFI